MLADVQSSYGLARPFHGAGNFETEHQRNLVREVCAAVQTGRLIVADAAWTACFDERDSYQVEHIAVSSGI